MYGSVHGWLRRFDATSDRLSIEFLRFSYFVLLFAGGMASCTRRALFTVTLLANKCATRAASACRTLPSGALNSSRMSNCTTIDAGVHAEGHSKTLCADLCLDTPTCQWMYSVDGRFASDCTLLTSCTPVPHEFGTGSLVSRSCMSHSPVVKKPGDEVFSVGHFGMALGVILLVMGLPAALWCRKALRKIRMEKMAASDNDVETGIGIPERPRAPGDYKTQFRSAGRAIIRAQQAADVLQSELFRRMVDEHARHETRKLAKEQESTVRGTRGEVREQLRAKHRQQRAALSRKLTMVDQGLTEILQDTYVSNKENDGVSSNMAKWRGAGKGSAMVRHASTKLVSQYDEHVKMLQTQLSEQQQSHSAQLEQRLAEKRAQMQARLEAMEHLLMADVEVNQVKSETVSAAEAVVRADLASGGTNGGGAESMPGVPGP